MPVDHGFFFRTRIVHQGRILSERFRLSIGQDGPDFSVMPKSLANDSVHAGFINENFGATQCYVRCCSDQGCSCVSLACTRDCGNPLSSPPRPSHLVQVCLHRTLMRQSPRREAWAALLSPFGDCTNSSCERALGPIFGCNRPSSTCKTLSGRERTHGPSQDASGGVHLSPLSSPPSARSLTKWSLGSLPVITRAIHVGHAPLDRFSGPVSFGARFVNLDVCRFWCRSFLDFSSRSHLTNWYGTGRFLIFIIFLLFQSSAVVVHIAGKTPISTQSRPSHARRQSLFGYS